MCADGYPIEMKCSSGQLFDHILLRCQPEAVAECYPGSNFEYV